MKRTTKTRSFILRSLAGVVLFLALGGPAPGNVGGCGATNAIADPVTHCEEKEFWLCRRDQFSGRIDEPTFQACLSRIDGMCMGNNWPLGCQPSPAQSDACIQLLMRGDLIHLTNEELLSSNDACNLCQ